MVIRILRDLGLKVFTQRLEAAEQVLCVKEFWD